MVTVNIFNHKSQDMFIKRIFFFAKESTWYVNEWNGSGLVTNTVLDNDHYLW